MKEKRVPTCHPDRAHWAKGLCQSCYLSARKSRVGEGEGARATCHPDRALEARGLCKPCYAVERRQGFSSEKVKKKKIPTCRPDRAHSAKGLCHPCYAAVRRSKVEEGRRANCHPDQPHVAKGLCKTYYAREYARKPETIAKRKNRYDSNPRSYRAKVLWKKYRVTEDDYDLILSRQGGCCKICKTAETIGVSSAYFDIDHCHATGQVRGLLCNRCNTGLGQFKDSPERLEKAAEYLRAHTSSAKDRVD